MTLRHNTKLIMVLIAVISFLIIQLAFYNMTSLSKGVEIIGTDPFMRLVRVEELNETFDWFDSVVERSNAPYGDELHWTRALDIILLGLAKGLSLIFPFPKALQYAGIILSPLLGVVLVCILIWMFKPVLKEENTSLIFLVFLSQPIFTEIYGFGRPDHHSLLLLTFAVLIGCMLRVVRPEVKTNTLLLTSFTMAYAMVISVESVMLVIFVFLVMSVHWILYGMTYLDRSIKLSGWLTVFTGVLLLIEKPLSDLSIFEYDKISIVYLAFFLIITSIFYITKRIFTRFYLINNNGDQERKIRFVRCLYLLVIGTIGATLMVVLFPDFIKGPFAGVNPAIKPIWLDYVKEVQPLFDLSLIGVGKLLIYLGMPILSGLYLLFNILNRKHVNNHGDVFLFIGMFVYGMLSLYQVRWIGYLQMISLIPVVLLFDCIILKVINGKSIEVVPILRSITIVVLLFGFSFTGIAMIVVSDEETQATMSTDALEELCDWMVDNEFLLGQQKTILTFLDFGPEILYRTTHRVISSPYHRNDEGILFSYNIMTSNDVTDIQMSLKTRSVDLILLLPNSTERAFYDYDENSESFYDMLLNHQLPFWIKEIELPKEHSEFRLFLVDQENI
ncbi:MAG: hypothetical protein JEZ08_11750 [Clostridiales bacterium]|nr:hypothetical protein [Clostridiales bacterium]